MKNKLYILNIFLFYFFYIGSSSALSQTSLKIEDIQKYDKNDNGEIDPGDEQTNLIYRIVNPSFIKIDLDKDGEISREEVNAAINNPDLRIKSKNSNRLWDWNSDFNQVRDNNSGQLTILSVEKHIARAVSFS